MKVLSRCEKMSVMLNRNEKKLMDKLLKLVYENGRYCDEEEKEEVEWSMNEKIPNNLINIFYDVDFANARYDIGDSLQNRYKKIVNIGISKFKYLREIGNIKKKSFYGFEDEEVFYTFFTVNEFKVLRRFIKNFGVEFDSELDIVSYLEEEIGNIEDMDIAC